MGRDPIIFCAGHSGVSGSRAQLATHYANIAALWRCAMRVRTCILIWLATTRVHETVLGICLFCIVKVLLHTSSKKIYRVRVYCLCSLRYMGVRLPIKVLFILHSSNTDRSVNHCTIRTITTYTTSSLW